MSIDKRRQTLQNLRRLAQEGSSPGERAAAQRAYSRLLQSTGLEPGDLEPALEEVEVDVRYKNENERTLLVLMGNALGLTVHQLHNYKRLKQLRFTGDKYLVELLPPLFKAHVKAFNARVEAYALGLAYAMFPAPSEPRKEGDRPAGSERTPEEEMALRAGYSQGERVGFGRKELEGWRLEDE